MEADTQIRVWRLDPLENEHSELAEAEGFAERRAVFVAASADSGSGSVFRMWLAVDDYDEAGGVVLFGAPPEDEFAKSMAGAPPGSEFFAYIGVLLAAGIEEAENLGFASLLAHWRGEWGSAEQILLDNGFAETAPGMWRRPLTP